MGKWDAEKEGLGGRFLLVHLAVREARVAPAVLEALPVVEMSLPAWNRLVLRLFRGLPALTGDPNRVPDPVSSSIRTDIF